MISDAEELSAEQQQHGSSSSRRRRRQQVGRSEGRRGFRFYVLCFRV